jgi:dihydroxyacetone kinase DhaKLM complex PTS-EIIA-like component DhaM
MRRDAIDVDAYVIEVGDFGRRHLPLTERGGEMVVVVMVMELAGHGSLERSLVCAAPVVEGA